MDQGNTLTHSRNCYFAVWGNFWAYSYFWCKIWRHILAWGPQFPIKVTKLCIYLV